MARGIISLNGQGYVVEHPGGAEVSELVFKEQIPDKGQIFQQEGGATQEGIIGRESRVFLPPSNGLGLARIPSDDNRHKPHYRRMFDSTCETRWAGQVTLGILNETETEPADSEVLRASAVFKGGIYSIWDRKASGSNYGVRSSKLSSTTWGDELTIDSSTADEFVGLDMVAHKTHLHVLYVDASSHKTGRNAVPDSDAWDVSHAAAITGSLLADAVSKNEDIDAGLLASSANELIAVIWDEDSGTITFFSSANTGDNWTDEAVDIASGNGPQGVAIYPDIDGTDKLYVGTHEGLWLVDISAGTWTTELIYPMLNHSDNCRRMTVHQGALYFAQGVDNNSAAPITRMVVSGDARIFEEGHGLNVNDGIPTALLGPVRWMKSAGDMLFISVGGGASSRNARVLCGITRQPEGITSWHHMFVNGTANQKIEWIDVESTGTTPRLHYSKRTATAASAIEFLNYATTNPHSLAAATIKTQTSGYIDYPYIDYGLPTNQGAVLQARVAANDLSASTSNEYINLDYGVSNPAAETAFGSFTNLGDIVSGTVTLDFASGAGVAMYSVSHRVNLIRDGSTNTDTPSFQSLEVNSLKHIDRRYRYTLKVDITATAELQGLNTEDVLANLETAENLKTLPVLSYGNTGSLYVRARLERTDEGLFTPGTGEPETAPDSNARRTGFVTVVCEEIV